LIGRVDLSRAVFRGFLGGLLVLIVLNGWASLGTTNRTRVVEGTDAAQYDKLARGLETDRGFSSDGPPFDPTFYREPGYPLFLALGYRLSGDNQDVVAMVQVGVLALTAGLTAMLGARLFGPLAGLAAGGLLGFSPEAVNYASTLLSETLFTFFLIATLGLAVRAREGRRVGDILLVGLGLGIAALTRAFALGLVVPLALALAWDGRRTRPYVFLTRAGLVVAGAVLVLAPWVVRNWVAVGRPALTSRSGVVVIRRMPRAAEPASAYAGWLQAAAWRVANPISNLVVPMERFQWGPEPEDNALWDFDVNEAVRYFNRYDPVCQAAPDWDACANEIGMAFVRKYPLQYLVQSGFEVVKLNFAPFPSPAGSVHNITVWLALLSGGVFAVRRRLNRLHGVVLVALGVYVGSAVLVDTQTRYSVPLLPVYAAFATAAPAAMLAWLARGGARVMRRLTRPGAAPAAQPTVAET
jgi:4-amino-4-deoxy-L-arabinose transferase-like glycosyltransferase